MSSAAVCLCIIFNHRFESNVPKLREIYKHRFSTIRFLMPFYRGTEPDIYPYYANCYHFQMCVTQNVAALSAIEASHYVFVADDLILNPTINETNILQNLKAGVDSISIPPVANLSSPGGADWARRLDIARIDEKATGMDWRSLLPPYADMVDRIKALGVSHRVDITHFYDDLARLGHRFPDTKPLIVDPPYPCLAAYSDIFVIPNQYLRDFAYFAGVTAAMSLFVEVAIPTAALIVSKQLSFIPLVGFDPAAGDEQFSGNGIAIWGDEQDKFVVACEANLKNAFSGPRSNALFIHPIKLSKWMN